MRRIRGERKVDRSKSSSDADREGLEEGLDPSLGEKRQENEENMIKIGEQKRIVTHPAEERKLKRKKRERKRERCQRESFMQVWVSVPG